MPLLKSLYDSDAAQNSMLLFRRRPYVISFGIFVLFILTIYELYPSLSTSRNGFTDNDIKGGFNGKWDWQRDGKNFLLNEEQCEQAFPGLFDEVKRAVKDRNGKMITLEEVDRIEPTNGYIRGMIYDQEASTRRPSIYIQAHAQTLRLQST